MCWCCWSQHSDDDYDADDDDHADGDGDVFDDACHYDGDPRMMAVTPISNVVIMMTMVMFVIMILVLTWCCFKYVRFTVEPIQQDPSIARHSR